VTMVARTPPWSPARQHDQISHGDQMRSVETSS
jgi:hypothetical protein